MHAHGHARGRLPARQLNIALSDALGWWEPLRIFYNVALAAVVIARVAATWPVALTADLESILGLFVLAVLANVCYCAAYLVDIPVQFSFFGAAWRRRRWMLWVLGTLFGMSLTHLVLAGS